MFYFDFIVFILHNAAGIGRFVVGAGFIMTEENKTQRDDQRLTDYYTWILCFNFILCLE
jgi:hypothetical protein